MKFVLVAACFLPLAFAAEYLVGVGKDETTGKKGMGFDPSVIHPAVGDVIAFEFRSGDHSVVQSTFENPCTGNGGFNSGVQTVADSISVDAPGLPQIRLVVNDTEPLWFFDEAGGLCHKGAVLAANPTLTQSAAAFVENAAKAPIAPPPSASSTGSDSSTEGSTPTGSTDLPAPTTNSAIKDNAHFSALGFVFAIVMGFL